MAEFTLSPEARKIVLAMQDNEITEYYIYNAIADDLKNEADAKILRQLAAEEKHHCIIWEGYTDTGARPHRGKIIWYSFLAKVFGYTFALKLMESGEDTASDVYADLSREIPDAKVIAEDENRHEQKLLGILDEERLQYVGSMVLGLNDALVELTGTLAGLTLAMQNTRLIAMAGLITGVAATLSMASSEYLSARSDGREDAAKSCTYTGVAYCLTVAILVAPYLVFGNEQYIYAMITMLILAVAIIFGFTYYISVAKELHFKKRFLEMAGISLGVALISFIIGVFVKEFLGVDM